MQFYTKVANIFHLSYQRIVGNAYMYSKRQQYNKCILKRGNVTLGVETFACHLKRMDRWVGTKYLTFCRAYPFLKSPWYVFDMMITWQTRHPLGLAARLSVIWPATGIDRASAIRHTLTCWAALGTDNVKHRNSNLRS